MSLKTFMEVFRGRRDCYGQQAYCMKEHLTEEVFKGHIEGKRRIGVYPIHNGKQDGPGKLASWIAVDIESSDNTHYTDIDLITAVGLKKKCQSLDLHAYIERSKNKGYHLYLFFDKDIEAYKLRIMVKHFVDELGFKCKLFPDCDCTSYANEVSGFIYLPFFGGDVVSGRTVFIDDDGHTTHNLIDDFIDIKINDHKLIDSIIESQSIAYNPEYENVEIPNDNNKGVKEKVITLTLRDAKEDVMVFQKKDYEFRISTIEFTKSGNYKCACTLSSISQDKVIFKDVINFNMASNRKRFIKATEDESIDEDLIKLHELVLKQLQKEERERLNKPKQLYIMTEKEKSAAVNFLEETPDILSKMINTTNRMGVVGEETVRLMVYLCFTSRITQNPLSITVKGESSSGKSFSCQNVQKLIPDEGFHFITRATAQAFYHMPEDGLQNRIVYINELPGSESADYSIRTAQSEGDLLLMMPVKDPQTGDQVTVTKRVKGPVGFLITTTKASMFDENETRNFSVFSDDSPKLTKDIGQITIRKAKGEEFIVSDEEINLWKNMQRLLNPDLKVIIPYAEEVFSSFPDRPVRIRRDRERFRVMIEIVTLLHQYHRKQEKQENTGKIIIHSTLADYYIAKFIAGDLLTYTIYEIGPSAEEIWKAINDMAEHPPKDHNPMHEFTFKYKDIAEFMNWRVEKVKKWMFALTRSGLVDYAEKTAGGKGRAAHFKITRQGEDFGSKTLKFLPEVGTLIDKYPCSEDLFYNPITGGRVSIHDAEAPEGLLEGLE